MADPHVPHGPATACCHQPQGLCVAGGGEGCMCCDPPHTLYTHTPHTYTSIHKPPQYPTSTHKLPPYSYTPPTDPFHTPHPEGAHGQLQAEPHSGMQLHLNPRGYTWHTEPGWPADVSLQGLPGQLLLASGALSTGGRSYTPSGQASSCFHVAHAASGLASC